VTSSASTATWSSAPAAGAGAAGLAWRRGGTGRPFNAMTISPAADGRVTV
jgi:hypothetical protein